MKVCSTYPLHCSCLHSPQPIWSAPLISAIVPPNTACRYATCGIFFEEQPARIAGFCSVIIACGQPIASHASSIGGQWPGPVLLMS